MKSSLLRAMDAWLKRVLPIFKLGYRAKYSYSYFLSSKLNNIYFLQYVESSCMFLCQAKHNS